MQRSVSALTLLFVALSTMIGSGWLFAPFYVAKLAGAAAILSWVAGAVFMLVIDMPLAELTTMFPVSGAQARFMMLSHGNFASFVFAFMTWLAFAAIAPTETIGILQYLSIHVPWLVHQTNGDVNLSFAGFRVAAAVLLLMCVINLASIKWLARCNNALAIIKLIVPLIAAIAIIVVGMHWQNFKSFTADTNIHVFSALSIGGIVMSFSGFSAALSLAGETKNPHKVIPMVLVGSLVCCLLIYGLLQIAFTGGVSTENLANGWQNLQLSHSASPFVTLSYNLHLVWLGVFILLVAVLAPLSTALISVTASSRTAYAMSKNGYMPAAFQRLNQAGVPVAGVVLNFVVGLLLFMPAPGWQQIAGFLISAFIISYAIGPVCTLALRKQLPNYPRKYRLPMVRLWSYLAFYFSNLLLYWVTWQVLWEMMAAIIVGIALFLISHRLKQARKPLDYRHGWWVILYLVGMAGISFYGNYGGRGLLPAGWDLIIVAVFSLGILWIAQASRLDAKESERHLQHLSTEVRFEDKDFLAH